MATEPTIHHIQDVLVRDGDMLCVGDEAYFWLDPRRCDCGDDNGIRYWTPWIEDEPHRCDGCGDELWR